MLAFALLGLLGIGLLVDLVADDEDVQETSDVNTLVSESGTTLGDERVDDVAGGDGENSIFGKGGNDFLTGGAGDDRLFGGDDDDHLLGESGDDFIRGGADDDTLWGGEGADTLIGDTGNGTDIVSTGLWMKAGESATITDFKQGTDLLAYNYDESESEPTISFTENQDNDAQLRINDDVVLVLRGVDFRTLSESDVRLFPNKV